MNEKKIRLLSGKKITFLVIILLSFFNSYCVENEQTKQINVNRGIKKSTANLYEDSYDQIIFNRNPEYTAYAYNAWDPTDEFDPGLLSFTLNNPQEMDYITESTTSEMMVAATYVEETIYAMEYITGNIYTISETGEFSFVGNSGISGNAIAYDVTSGKLYAADTTDLYEIDLETGNGTFIGAIENYSLIIAMTCDNDGNLFGIDMNDDNLYSINKVTGVGTIVGSLGIDINFAQDMDYDRDGEACYLAAIGHTMPSRLYAIDLDTGNASFIAPIQNGMEITGLAIPYGLAQTGILAGTITLNGGTGNVEEVAISIENEVHYPDENGYFSFDVDCGTYDISFLLTGYESQTIEGVVIHEEETTNINVTLEVETGGTQIPAGNVTGTWNLSGSPYLVNGEINVPNGQTLNIEPGVIVRFQGHYKFIINGRILAIGTESEMIKFTADDTDTGWFGIRFENTSAVNDSSKIVYCEIEHGNAYGGTEPTDGAGGGIAIIGFDKVLVSHCDIHDNHADTSINSPGGGGIMTSLCDPVITRNKIHHNTTAVAGGGIFVYNSSNPTISYNLIYENYAEWDGAGIECYHECSPEIFNNTIVYNNAGEAGGGIDVYTNCSPNLTNNIIYGNTAPYGPQAFLYTNNCAPNFYYNDIQDGFDGIELNYGVSFGGDFENNIEDNPMFADLINYDYNLLENSPCIDAGDPNFLLDPDGTTSDIGALFFDQGVSADDEYAVNSDRIFMSNYPNPFNSSTTISFQTNNQLNGQKKIEIYNFKGQRVRKLVSDQVSAGLHSVVWDGKDDSGKQVSSGIYLYKLKAGDFEQTKRMIYLK